AGRPPRSAKMTCVSGAYVNLKNRVCKRMTATIACAVQASAVGQKFVGPAIPNVLVDSEDMTVFLAEMRLGNCPCSMIRDAFGYAESRSRPANRLGRRP